MPSSDATPRSLAKGRYEIRAVIGRGASGEVLRVLDRERQRNVALKRLLRLDAQDAFLIKREFRALADAKHPNVVELYDLWSEGGKLFYTMELVRGGDVVGFAGEPRGTANPFERVARVSRLLPQLAAGLRALHSQRVLHRDIKPHNVLVEPGTDGASARLVLLDFGVLATVTPDARDTASKRELVGAVAYAAPEQLWLGKASEASDWYAAGVLLYEALTGQLPYEGRPHEIASAKRTKPAPRLDRERIPPWLAELVESLCAAKPADRPTHADVIAVLARAGVGPAGDAGHDSALPTVRRVGAWSADLQGQEFPFHGREREMRLIEDAFARGGTSGGMLVCVSGESGIGKSELLLRALDGQERAGRAIVFRGRCHPHESIPYKALDQIVDDLSRHLMIDARATAHVDARRLDALTRLFPVLTRVKAVAERCEDVSHLEPGLLREEGAHGLRDLLSAIAAEQPVVIWIDDAQWGDADSATVLRIVLDPAARTPSNPISLALSYRPEAERSSPVVRALLEEPQPHDDEFRVTLSLQPLAGDDAARLAADLLRARGMENSATIAAIARDSGGSPFFIGELARSDVDLSVAASALRTERALGVASVVRKRFERLRGGAREILELVALAGAPLAEPLALRAAGVDRAGAGDVDDLERLCLLRTYDTAEQRMLQPYHDRIAEAVRDALSAPRQRWLHGAIAAALEEQPDAEPELLVFHYRGAEATVLAARHAQRAARRAYAALAFDRAAEMFQFAALHTDQDAARAPLWAGLAESLASAGRGEDAARAFETAADAVPDGSADVQALDYRRRAAEQLLKCGHVTGGIARMRDVLAFFRERLPETPGEGMRSLLLQRGRLALRGLRFVERETSGRLQPYEAARLDAMWATCISVSMVNPTLSVALSTRHLIDVLESGDKPRICQALAHEAAWRTSFGRRYHRRALSILDTARELARELGTPYERAWASMAEGVMHWQSGRWREAISPLESALSIYRTECRGVFFEIAIVHMYLYASLALAGEIARLRSTLLGETAVDERRNDRFALHGALLGESVVGWLADGDATNVLARADEVISEWPAGSFLMQHYHHLTTTVQADIYLGNGAGAWRRMTTAWPRLFRAGFLNLDCPALGLRFLRARAALALLAADAKPAHRRTLLAGVRREARRMEHSALPAAPVFAAIVRAGIAGAGGDNERCAAELRAAHAAAGFAHMPLHGAAAEIALGHVIGGDEGDALAAGGREWMAAQGVADPERMSATVCPVRALRLRAT